MIRVAAYQATPLPSFESRKEQILGALEKADQDQIDFLCFPEGFLTGYTMREKERHKFRQDFISEGSSEFDIDHWWSMRTRAKLAEERLDEFDTLFSANGIITKMERKPVKIA